MISKRIPGRKDGKSSASDSLRYCAGLNIDRTTRLYTDKALRIRLGGFGLIENGIYVGQPIEVILDLIELAAIEMQANLDMNTRVTEDKKIAHLVFSFGQTEPTEAVLCDVEDSTRRELNLEDHHFGTFLHCDNGQFHQHLILSRVSSRAPHNGNSLWRDRTLRDKVCREVEIRHNLARDRGLHRIDASGEIVEIPIAERRENRGKQQGISGCAKKVEIVRGEKSVQTWCFENRLGDSLGQATSWQELHSIAADYSCEIRAKGAGFILRTLGEKGSVQLSKLGVKNLSRRFGPFQSATAISSLEVKGEYQPAPTKAAGSLYDDWKVARASHQELKTKALSKFREAVSLSRHEVRERQKQELAKIRTSFTGSDRQSAISIEKMKHSAEQTQLAAVTREARSTLYKTLAETAPGTNFRDYLQKQAQSGDDAALELVRQFGIDEATSVSIKTEFIRLKIVGAISGAGNKRILRASMSHYILHSGTIVYDLGRGRSVTDSAVAKRIQLNAAAACDVEAIEISLRFATKRFGTPLTLFGPVEFQRLAVETAVQNKLQVEFLDPVLEEYRKTLLVRTFHKDIRNVERTKINQVTKIPSTNRGDRVHPLSFGPVAFHDKDDAVLLQADVSRHVGEPLPEKHTHSQLRRNANGGHGDNGTPRNVPTTPVDPKRTSADSGGVIPPTNEMKNVAVRLAGMAPRRGRQAISNKPLKGR